MSHHPIITLHKPLVNYLSQQRNDDAHKRKIYSKNSFLLFQDLALDFGILAESFETSVPWDKCESLCRNVKSAIQRECQKHGIQYFLISCRVTQTYDAGACVYFYFGFRWNSDCKDPVALYEEIENNARDEVLASGEF